MRISVHEVRFSHVNQNNKSHLLEIKKNLSPWIEFVAWQVGND